VAGRRVLSWRARGAFAVTSSRMRGQREMFERFDIREAQAHEIWQMQRARAGDVSKRVAAHVAVVSGIGEFADTDAVENNPDYAREVRGTLPHDCLPANSPTLRN
jgi:hypothetical protein